MHSKENADMFADKKMVQLDPEMFDNYLWNHIENYQKLIPKLPKKFKRRLQSDLDR